MASEPTEDVETTSQYTSSSSSETEAGIENPNWNPRSTLRITHPALLAAAQYNPSRLVVSAPFVVLGEASPNMGSTEDLEGSKDSGRGESEGRAEVESRVDVEHAVDQKSPANIELSADMGSPADARCSVPSEWGVVDLPYVTQGNFIYSAGWTAQQAMEISRAKKRPVFDLVSVSSSSSVSVEGKGLENELSSTNWKECGRPVDIERILKAAWHTQFSEASSFASARVEEVGLPGHSDFIPKDLNFEGRQFCIRWSCFVGVEVVAAWQRGEIGCGGGFYSEEELKMYKIDAARDDGGGRSSSIKTHEDSNGTRDSNGFLRDGGRNNGDRDDTGDNFGLNGDDTPAERGILIDRYIDYYHLT